MFALRFIDTKELVRFEYTSTSGHEDGDGATVAFELSASTLDQIWCVTERHIAECAATTTSAWYNAGFETPTNRFIGRLEVVELTVKEPTA